MEGDASLAGQADDDEIEKEIELALQEISEEDLDWSEDNDNLSSVSPNDVAGRDSAVESEQSADAAAAYSVVPAPSSYLDEMQIDLNECDTIISESNKKLSELIKCKYSEELTREAEKQGKTAKQLKAEMLAELSELDKKLEENTESEEHFAPSGLFEEGELVLVPSKVNSARSSSRASDATLTAADHVGMPETPSIQMEVPATPASSVGSSRLATGYSVRPFTNMSTGRMATLSEEWQQYLQQMEQEFAASGDEISVDPQTLENEAFQRLLRLHRSQKALDKERTIRLLRYKKAIDRMNEEKQQRWTSAQEDLTCQQEQLQKKKLELMKQVEEQEEATKRQIGHLEDQHRSYMEQHDRLFLQQTEYLRQQRDLLERESREREHRAALLIQRFTRGFLSRRKYGLLIKLRRKRMQEWREMRDADRFAEYAWKSRENKKKAAAATNAAKLEAKKQKQKKENEETQARIKQEAEAKKVKQQQERELKQRTLEAKRAAEKEELVQQEDEVIEKLRDEAKNPKKSPAVMLSEKKPKKGKKSRNGTEQVQTSEDCTQTLSTINENSESADVAQNTAVTTESKPDHISSSAVANGHDENQHDTLTENAGMTVDCTDTAEGKCIDEVGEEPAELENGIHNSSEDGPEIAVDAAAAAGSSGIDHNESQADISGVENAAFVASTGASVRFDMDSEMKELLAPQPPMQNAATHDADAKTLSGVLPGIMDDASVNKGGDELPQESVLTDTGAGGMDTVDNVEHTVQSQTPGEREDLGQITSEPKNGMDEADGDADEQTGRLTESSVQPIAKSEIETEQSNIADCSLTPAAGDESTESVIRQSDSGLPVESSTANSSPNTDAVEELANQTPVSGTGQSVSVPGKSECVLGESLPAVLDRHRINWMTDCIPWMKIKAAQKQSISTATKTTMRMGSSTAASRKLPKLGEKLLLESVGRYSALQNVTTVVLRDLPGYNMAPLASCANLEYLVLDSCSLTSLDMLTACFNLRFLSAKHNKLDAVDLSGLSRLVEVDLSSNKIATLTGTTSGLAIHGCCNLRVLNLFDNKIARLAASLSSLKALYCLNISANQLISTRGLSTLSTVQFLDISSNHISSLDELDSLALLTHLNASSNNIQEMPRLSNHVLLRHVDLSRNSLSSVSTLAIAWLPLLTSLNLSNNNIEELPGGLGNFLLLDRLDISCNQMTDHDALTHSLAYLPSIGTLSTADNPCFSEPDAEDAFRNAIRSSLLKLRSLNGVQLESTSCADVDESPSKVQFTCSCLSQIEALDKVETAIKKLSADHVPVMNNRNYLQCKLHLFDKLQSLSVQFREQHEFGEMTICPDISIDLDHILAENSGDDTPVVISGKPPLSSRTPRQKGSATPRRQVSADLAKAQKTPRSSASHDISQQPSPVTGKPPKSPRTSATPRQLSARSAHNMEAKAASQVRDSSSAVQFVRDAWKDAVQDPKPAAAVKIQSRWRGYWVRKKLATIQAQVEDEINALLDEDNFLNDDDPFMADLAKMDEDHAFLDDWTFSDLKPDLVSETEDSMKLNEFSSRPSDVTLSKPREDSLVTKQYITRPSMSPVAETDVSELDLESSSASHINDNHNSFSARHAKIQEDWGFKSQVTADLMLKRAKKMSKVKKHIVPVAPHPSSQLSTRRHLAHQQASHRLDGAVPLEPKLFNEQLQEVPGSAPNETYSRVFAWVQKGENDNFSVGHEPNRNGHHQEKPGDLEIMSLRSADNAPPLRTGPPKQISQPMDLIQRRGSAGSQDLNDSERMKGAPRNGYSGVGDGKPPASIRSGSGISGASSHSSKKFTPLSPAELLNRTKVLPPISPISSTNPKKRVPGERISFRDSPLTVDPAAVWSTGSSRKKAAGRK